MNGQIYRILVSRGEQVKAGQVLAYFDEREAEVLERKAEAVMTRDKEVVQELSRKLERLRNVLLKGGEAPQVVEDAEAALRAAKARLQVDEVELRFAQLNREKTKVVAPFDGIVTDKTVEVGQWVEAGGKLFTLVAKQGWEIEVNVDAADSGMVQRGQTVMVSCDAFPGKEWAETVHWIAPVIISNEQEAMNTFAVRTTLSSKAPPLLIRQQVDVKILTTHRDDALKLPYSALLEAERGTAKVAVLSGGKVHFVPVVTGIEDLTHVEIVSGLTKDEQVILPQGKALTEGESVIATRD
jgi:RND family efflux transporter MFP subunit